MIFCTAVALTLLAYINYRLSGRVLVYPAVAFCSVWAADLYLLWLSGNYFLPLSDETLLIFGSGALAFSAGSLAALFGALHPATAAPVVRRPTWTINLLLVLCVCAFPFFLRWIISVGTDSDETTLIRAVRMATIDQIWGPPAGYTLFLNVAGLARITAMIAYLEPGMRRKTFAVLLAVLFDLFMATRGTIILFFFTLICLEWLKKRQLPWKTLLPVGLAAVLVFGFMAIEVGKSGASADAPFAENVVSIEKGFVEYAAGGLVAFDRLVRSPNVVTNVWKIEYAVLDLMNRAGAHFQIPQAQDTFVDIGPTSINVFTLYSGYFHFGFLGMTAMVFLVGFVTTLVYNRAMAGSRIAALTYGTLFAAVLLSVFAEGFFYGLNFLLKLWIVYGVVYYLPASYEKWFGGSPTRARRRRWWFPFGQRATP